jgi:hypothetical protein
VTTATLRARAPRPDDVPAILRLFRDAFGKTISPEHYRWKLLSRPSPVENVVVVEDERDGLIFHSAGIPCRCRLRGTERWVMLGADVMTAPAYRRRGLNTRFSSEMYARWKDAGVALILGFTNQEWGSSARKVGLRPLGPLDSLVFPLRPERILARKTGWSVLAGSDLISRLWRKIMVASAPRDERLLVEAVETPGDEFDDLWEDTALGIERSLVRDRAWVTWRYFESPDIRYRVLLARRGGAPVGYAAFVAPSPAPDSVPAPAPRAGNIAEIFAGAGDAAVFGALLRATLDSFMAAGIEVVRTLAAPGSWSYRAFRGSGFIGRGRGVVEHLPLDPSLSPRDIGEARDWHFAAGDFDAV